MHRNRHRITRFCYKCREDLDSQILNASSVKPPQKSFQLSLSLSLFSRAKNHKRSVARAHVAEGIFEGNCTRWPESAALLCGRREKLSGVGEETFYCVSAATGTALLECGIAADWKTFLSSSGSRRAWRGELSACQYGVHDEGRKIGEGVPQRLEVESAVFRRLRSMLVGASK